MKTWTSAVLVPSSLDTILGKISQLREKIIKNFGLPAPIPSLNPARVLFASVLLLLLFASGPVWPTQPSAVSPAKPAEYMIYQYPGVTLLIQIDAIETEFESRVFDPERALIKYSRLPSRRIGPVYQLIEAVDTARQLIIEVTPAYPTDRSRIRMELVQLNQHDRNSAIQAEAFRLMSRAADSTTANDSTTWAMKSYTFKRAAEAFEQLGWEELQLWSEYYVAHLVFYKLQDEYSAIELAQQVQTAARKAGFGEIELAALQLKGAALLAESKGSPATTSQRKFSEAHRVLGQAAQLADSIGLQSERALALFSDGVAWEKQEELSQALGQYRLALDIAVSAGDTELANRIRNSAAFAYETQGRISGALEMLDQIGDELSEEEAALGLAQSLYKKGRILNSNYRYREAAEALSEAVNLQESAGSVQRAAQSGLALGQAYYGMGLMDKAATTQQESIDRLPASGYEEELDKALNVLAAASRSQGDFDAMSKARKRQTAFVSSDAQRARYLFEQALDLLAKPDSAISVVRSLLKQSRQFARDAGIPLLAHRAQLQLCAHMPSGTSAAQDCSAGNTRRSFDKLQAAGIPRYALEARTAWSEILRQQGSYSQAIEQMSQIVRDVRYFRNVLPGVLGAWYWESRDRIFSDYMSIVLQQSLRGSQAQGDGRQALSVLEQLRAIVSEDSSGYRVANPVGREGESERIRSLLAAQDAMPDDAADLQRASVISGLLNQSKEDFEKSDPGLKTGSLNGLLGHLPDQGVLLSYYFSSDKAYAIVAGQSVVRLFRLSRPGSIQSGLNELRKDFANPAAINNSSLDSLGNLMLKPISHLLTEHVYLMPVGLVHGIPFDLIRLDGHYLAEHHNVINLMSLSALETSIDRLGTRGIDLFFLAGNPDVQREVFNYEQEMSAEIRAVTDIFVGPNLHIVQGSALNRDEFQDQRFERADVVHLAIPGLISLEFPSQSKLMLSGTLEQPGNEFLRPGDFQDRHFNAFLAILSSTRLHGESASRFNGRLGFVTDLLQSGVDAVVASLWLLGDSELAYFMDAFYQNLANNPDAVIALLKTRRQVFSESKSENIRLWAGFQVYVN